MPRKLREVPMQEWVERELREGRLLNEYIRREKATMDDRIRRVARARHGLRPNPKTEDLRLIAEVPGRLYHRMRGVDPDFWLDKKNLKSLKRDNEDMRGLIHV